MRTIVLAGRGAFGLDSAKERLLRTGRGKIAEKGNALARLRVSDAGPDPRFRAVLRERLVAAASDRGDDGRNRERHDGSERGR